MKHRFFKDGKVDMVEITVDKDNVVVRPATKEDHENAKRDDPDVKPTPPQPTPPQPQEDAAHAKKSKYDDE